MNYNDINELIFKNNIIPTFLEINHKCYYDHAELLYNVIRIISKTSLLEKCRSYFVSNHEYIRFLLRIYDLYGTDPKQYQMIIRISFILANFTTTNVNNRVIIGKKFGGARTLCDLLVKYVEVFKTKSTDNEINDLLIKMIRLIANLSVSPEISPIIVRHKSLLLLPTIITQTPNEELLLNCLSLYTNTTYCCSFKTDASKLETPIIDTIIYEDRINICNTVIPYLVHENEEVICETCRTISNLSLLSDVCDSLMKRDILKILNVLLSHTMRLIVFTSMGIIINLFSKAELKTTVADTNYEILDSLITIMSTGFEDIDMSSMACKALTNYLGITEGTDLTPSLLMTPAQLENTRMVSDRILTEDANNISLPDNDIDRESLNNYMKLMECLSDILCSVQFY